MHGKPCQAGAGFQPLVDDRVGAGDADAVAGEPARGRRVRPGHPGSPSEEGLGVLEAADGPSVRTSTASPSAPRRPVAAGQLQVVRGDRLRRLEPPDPKGLERPARLGRRSGRRSRRRAGRTGRPRTQSPVSPPWSFPASEKWQRASMCVPVWPPRHRSSLAPELHPDAPRPRVDEAWPCGTERGGEGPACPRRAAGPGRRPVPERAQLGAHPISRGAGRSLPSRTVGTAWSITEPLGEERGDRMPCP